MGVNSSGVITPEQPKLCPFMSGRVLAVGPLGQQAPMMIPCQEAKCMCAFIQDGEFIGCGVSTAFEINQVALNLPRIPLRTAGGVVADVTESKADSSVAIAIEGIGAVVDVVKDLAQSNRELVTELKKSSAPKKAGA